MNEKNKIIYQKYLNSKIAINMSTKDTTYKTYENSMNDFINFLYKEDKNYYLLSNKVLKNMISILESYI